MIVVCPRCRASGDAGQHGFAWVTCSRASCRHEFLAWPPGTAVDAKAELRERKFFCAVTGKAFFAVFGRRSKAERLQVLKMHAESGWLRASLLKRERDRAAALVGRTTSVAVRGAHGPGQELVVGGNAPAPSLRSMMARYLRERPVADDVGQPVRFHARRATAEQVLAAMAAAEPREDDLDFSQVDLDGWHCCHCDVATRGGHNFVRCGCGLLVCLGRSEVRKTELYFRCTPNCGREGFTCVASVAVGGERFSIPQAVGRAGLLEEPKTKTLTHQPQRPLK